MNFSSTTKPNISTSIWTTKLGEIDRVTLSLSKGGLAAPQDWVFFGPYACHVERSIKVPEGEAGLLFMRDFVRSNKRVKAPGEPAFTEGFVGFLSYDLGARWQGISYPGRFCHAEPVEACISRVPDAHFVYVDRVLNLKEISAAALTSHFLGTSGSAAPAAASRLVSRPRRPPSAGPSRPALRYVSQKSIRNCRAAPKSNLSREEYFKNLQRIKEYLYAGDTYQVNFSQKFEAPYEGSAFELFQKLVAINPSPHQFFMETQEFAVISNSPERLFRVIASSAKQSRSDKIDCFGLRPQSDIIETQPIKGTMPRGATLEEDEKNIKQLLASKKDEAELAMIVDLSRNDIGKICRPGTVEVTKNRAVEKYSHVIHTMATVRGIMESQFDWYDALHALFPGGSVTGCPKKRTMEIISELEQEPRGIYCGSAGWIDLSGACDFNILIRTLLYQKSVDPLQSGQLSFRSGGGIVVDSNPQNEYEETLHKAGAIINVIGHGSTGSP